MRKTTDFTNLAYALTDAREAYIKDCNAPITLIFRKYGYSTIVKDVALKAIESSPVIDETLAKEVFEDSKKVYKQRKEKRLQEEAEARQKNALAPLPLASKDAEDPLDRFEPREL